MKFLFTCDVELTSIPHNREMDGVADDLLRTGLPRVLDVCALLDVPATFYFTANLAEQSPDCLDIVRDQGHEIGCHGLSHRPDMGYDTLAYEDQLQSITRAREILERLGAGPVRSFRAPEARINEDTIRALDGLGFTSDSSVSSQRFDGPLSRGLRHKLRWLVAPRRPYFLSTSSVVEPGSTGVLEIPISALLLPFIGTSMRISPGLMRVLRRALFNEARHNPEHPIVFLFHPNECLDYPTPSPIGATGKAVIADRLRTSIKMRNLGLPAVRLLKETLSAALADGFEFTTATRFRNQFKRGAA